MSETSAQEALDSIKDIPKKRLEDVVNFIDFLKWQERKRDVEFDEWAINLAREKGFGHLTEDEVTQIVHLHRR